MKETSCMLSQDSTAFWALQKESLHFPNKNYSLSVIFKCSNIRTASLDN